MNTAFNNVTVCAYAARFPFESSDEYVSGIRREEICACRNVQTRQAKFYSWKLLEIAARQTFGLELSKLHVERTENGKWRCGEFEFSLSHSGSVVAVALSNSPVGIDVERINLPRFNERMQRRIMTDNEWQFAQTLTLKERQTYANVIWTEKEALFKLRGESSFVPAAVDTQYKKDVTCITEKVVLNNESYILTVACAACAAEVVFKGVNVDILDVSVKE